MNNFIYLLQNAPFCENIVCLNKLIGGFEEKNGLPKFSLLILIFRADVS